MERESKHLESTRQQIERHFGFMLERGFAITYADYSPEHFGNWTVDVSSSACTMHVSSDRDFIGLEFSMPGERDPLKRVSFEDALRGATRGQVVLEPFRGNLFWGRKKQLQRLATVLEEHIDEVLEYFKSAAS